MKTFILNGKEITPKPITFNTICQLEEMGLDIIDLDTKTFTFVRVFVQIWGGYTKEEAGNQIDEHLREGGGLEDVLNAITEAVSESSFFNRGGKKKSPAKLKKTPEPTDSDI